MLAETTPWREGLSRSATLILQIAYASGRRSLYLEPDVMGVLGLGDDAEEEAVGELRARGLLVSGGDWDGEVTLIPAGRAAIERIWPQGQLPDASGPRVVVGAFYGEEELPIRLAVPVPDLANVLLPRGRLLRGTEDREMRCRA